MFFNITSDSEILHNISFALLLNRCPLISEPELLGNVFETVLQGTINISEINYHISYLTVR